MAYVFGPIASRRLGVSLGVDLVPPKTCPLDCVYCEAGKTTDLTRERREYVPVDKVLEELDAVLSKHPKLDYVTFSGSGEPTLNSRIGDVVRFVKRNYPEYPLCLLTNAMLFGDEQLLKDIAEVDLAVPSLDGSNAEEFEKINRPVPGFSFDRFVDDLVRFTQNTKSRVNLELFIVPGVNDGDASIARFVELIKRMRVDLVQLNTLDRPGVEKFVVPSTPENTHRFIAALAPFVPVEAVGVFRYRAPVPGKKFTATESQRRILELIRRRPATLPDLALALELPESITEKILDELFAAGKVGIERQARGVFYLPSPEE
ncbi:MAG: radical SAM protein [Lentisphaeria bacterium]|nr:radical SAM protein [Lentisphaeria bacterium]